MAQLPPPVRSPFSVRSRAEPRFARLMLRIVALALAGAVWLGSGQAAAQERPRAVVLVMESSLGMTGAAKVRASLRRQSSASILSVSEAEAGGVKPGVMLVVELDRGQKVTVLYVDERGQTDVLTAPIAADSPDVTGIVATLAAALLQRHPALPPAPQGSEGGAERNRSTRDASLELANASRALYAALGRMGMVQRRTGRLSADDF